MSKKLSIKEKIKNILKKYPKKHVHVLSLDDDTIIRMEVDASEYSVYGCFYVQDIGDCTCVFDVRSVSELDKYLKVFNSKALLFREMLIDAEKDFKTIKDGKKE